MLSPCISNARSIQMLFAFFEAMSEAASAVMSVLPSKNPVISYKMLILHGEKAFWVSSSKMHVVPSSVQKQMNAGMDRAGVIADEELRFASLSMGHAQCLP